MGLFDKLLGNDCNKGNDETKIKSGYNYCSLIVSLLEHQIRQEGIESLSNNDVCIALNSRYSISMIFGKTEYPSPDIIGSVMLDDVEVFNEYVKSFPKYIAMTDEKKAMEIYTMFFEIYLGEKLDRLAISIFGALCQKVPELRKASTV